uniref:Uncharacterized protein n=1 Tax=Latimeria chalumnae TaxID=7897 RepID=H3A1Q4_LATCH
TEELVNLASMHGTVNGLDMFNELSKTFKDCGLEWDKLVSVTPYGTPAMIGSQNGLIAHIRKKVSDQDALCIIHQEALSSSVVRLKYTMEVIVKTVNCIRAHAMNHRVFKVFLGEVAMPYGGLSYHTEARKLQNRNHVISHLYDTVTTFQAKVVGKNVTLPEPTNI